MPRHNFAKPTKLAMTIGPSSKFYGVACVVEGCMRQAVHEATAGFLCGSHYLRLRNRGTLADAPRGEASLKPEYRHWINMRSRCNTPSSTGFEHYGGRGIRVCTAWEASFEAFYADMGPRPAPGYSVDRIDVNGHYEPGNCRWATQKMQSRNIRSNHLVEVSGELITVAEASERTGIKQNTILYRLRRGWSVEQAVSLPPRKGGRTDAPQ